MGNPKISIGGMKFPINKRVQFTFDTIPLRSGGYLIKQKPPATLDVLTNPKRPEQVKQFRVTLDNVFGAKKKIMVFEDMVKIGDRIYRREKPPKSAKRKQK